MKTKSILVLIILSVVMTALLFSDETNKSYLQSPLILQPIEIISLPDSEFYEKGCGFTCTGLTYDLSDDCFWAANYGKCFTDDSNYHPSLLKISKDFSTVLNEIDLSKNEGIADLQGITLDNSNDTIWMCTRNRIINIDKEGKELNSFELSVLNSKVKPNGLLYYDTNDSLLILCDNTYLFEYSKNGTQMNESFINFEAQDHLCWINDYIGITIGKDYAGNQNYLTILDSQKRVKNMYMLIDSYAVEGCYYLGDKLYVLNDGLYHDAAIRKNYVAVYLLPQTGEVRNEQT